MAADYLDYFEASIFSGHDVILDVVDDVDLEHDGTADHTLKPSGQGGPAEDPGVVAQRRWQNGRPQVERKARKYSELLEIPPPNKMRVRGRR